MSLRFRRSMKLLPGVRLNFSKETVGLSFGVPGARYTMNSKGRRTFSTGIPGTGLYKKQPFFGTREERMQVREIANEIINNSGLEVIQWPSEWIDADGTKMLDILEMKQSVHLRPKHYPHLSDILK